MKISFSLQVYHHRPMPVRSGNSPNLMKMSFWLQVYRHSPKPGFRNFIWSSQRKPFLKIAFSLQVYHHRPQRVRSRHSPQPLQNLIPLMDPQKAPQGTLRGGSQALPKSPQEPPGTFPSTPAEALGAPKAAHEPSECQGGCPEPAKCNTRGSKASKYLKNQ